MRVPITLNLSTETYDDDPSRRSMALDPTSDQPILVELQGSIQVEGSSSSSIAGTVVGTLDFKDPMKPTLKISHHLLKGSRVKLDKPLAVIRHTYPNDSESHSTKSLIRGRHEIVGLVREKLTFSKRPEPIIRLSSPDL